MKIANRNSSQYVQNCELFKANNLYSESNDDFYIVFSYGSHWPLWVYCKRLGMWLENTDKYSVTTSKHKSQSNPCVDTVKMSVNALRKFLSGDVCL